METLKLSHDDPGGVDLGAEDILAQWIGIAENEAMSKSEEEEIEKLLAEASLALPAELGRHHPYQHPDHKHHAKLDISISSLDDYRDHDLGPKPHPEDHEESPEDIIARIRDELAHRPASPLAPKDTHIRDSGGDGSSGGAGDDDDDDPSIATLRSRLTSLSPAPSTELPSFPFLPSVPTSLPPFPKPPSATMTRAQFKRYREEQEAEHWCCICNADAEFKCSGCEGDLFCEECLLAGHVGPEAGFEERRHKWTRYSRGKRVAA